MRELSALDSYCFAVLILSSIVLPMTMSVRGPKSGQAKRECMFTVFLGQTIGGLAAASVLISPKASVPAAVVGVLSCVFFLKRLKAQIERIESK